MYQGILTEGKGSVQLTSSLRQVVLQKREKYSISIKTIRSEQVSTRRSTVLILSFQLGFPDCTKVEVENSGKRSSLLRHGVNYARKSFISQALGANAIKLSIPLHHHSDENKLERFKPVDHSAKSNTSNEG